MKTFPRTTATALVVIEPEASRFDPLPPEALAAMDSQLLILHEDEGPERQERIVLDQLQALKKSDRCLTSAVIFAAPQLGSVADQTRVNIARHLLDALESHGSAAPVLWLMTAHSGDPELQHQMLTLAGRLTSELKGPSPVIAVRFGEPTGEQFTSPPKRPPYAEQGSRHYIH